MNFSLPNLEYSHNGLKPIINTDTVRIHHTLHHNTYVTNLNNACREQNMSKTNTDLLSVLQNSQLMANNPAIRNNGGGHYNHSLYWYILKPLTISTATSQNEKIDPESDPSVTSLVIVQGLIQQHGSLTSLKDKMTAEGLKRFGSGWVWLCIDKTNPMSSMIVTTPNQDNPLMNLTGGVDINNWQPVIGIDVWEHAYYLDYQNRRKDYLDDIWYLIDWIKVNEVYNATNGLPAGALD